MPKKHFLAVDFLRVIAILAVVLIHTTTRTIQAASNALPQIPLTLFFNQVSIFAVPLFFLISGFVLTVQKNDDSYLTYFQKRASRIIIPFLFWSLFYYLINIQTPGRHAAFFDLLWLGKTSYQLYFIPSIIIFYLLYPLLKKLLWLLSKWYVLLPLCGVQLSIIIQDYYIRPYALDAAFRIALLGFVFFPLGMVAAHYHEQILRFVKKYLFVCLGILAMLIVFIYSETWYLFSQTKRVHYFYSQFHPAVLPYTVLIGGLSLYLFSKKEYYKSFFMQLSKLSFFVFFVHVYIIALFWNYAGKAVFQLSRSTIFEQTVFDLGFFFIVAGVSFGIAYLVHKIPFVGKITG